MDNLLVLLKDDLTTSLLLFGYTELGVACILF